MKKEDLLELVELHVQNKDVEFNRKVRSIANGLKVVGQINFANKLISVLDENSVAITAKH